MKKKLQLHRTALRAYASRRVMQSPTAYIDIKRMELDAQSSRLLAAQERRIAAAKQRFGRAAAALDALSPLKVLGRGYAVASGAGGVLRSVRDAAPGDAITLRLNDGSMGCTVNTIKADE